MRVVVIGRQGSGKGTQCARLAAYLGVAHISSGDLFREAVAAETQLGAQLRPYLASGELVPEGLALAVLAERLRLDDATGAGFVLDGFPRTLSQARRLAAMIAPAHLDAVFELSVPEPVVLQRLLDRRICADCCGVESVAVGRDEAPPCSRCGGALVTRDDDAEPVIRRRLQLYEAETAPLTRWYRAAGVLTRIDGVGPPDVVGERFVDALPPARDARGPGGPDPDPPRAMLPAGSLVGALAPVVPPLWIGP